MATRTLPSLARKLDRAAIEALLQKHYATIYRMATGLSGREDVGRGVVRHVMSRGLAQLDKWHDEAQAESWFLHHTVLTSRRATKHQPDVKKDLLVAKADGSNADPAYLAFVRAIRALPVQQKEAFLLAHGENLNTRFLGIAMDCSTAAASVHLTAARQAMRAVSGEQYDAFVTALGQAYRTLSPAERLVAPRVRRIVGRHVWPRRLTTFVGWVILLSIVGGISFAAWWVWKNVEF